MQIALVVICPTMTELSNVHQMHICSLVLDEPKINVSQIQMLVFTVTMKYKFV